VGLGFGYGRGAGGGGGGAFSSRAPFTGSVVQKNGGGPQPLNGFFVRVVGFFWGTAPGGLGVCSKRGKKKVCCRKKKKTPGGHKKWGGGPGAGGNNPPPGGGGGGGRGSGRKGQLLANFFRVKKKKTRPRGRPRGGPPRKPFPTPSHRGGNMVPRPKKKKALRVGGDTNFFPVFKKNFSRKKCPFVPKYSGGKGGGVDWAGARWRFGGFWKRPFRGGGAPESSKGCFFGGDLLVRFPGRAGSITARRGNRRGGPGFGGGGARGLICLPGGGGPSGGGGGGGPPTPSTPRNRNMGGEARLRGRPPGGG